MRGRPSQPATRDDDSGCRQQTRILARNFEPGFYVEHFIKDMGIALAEAERMNLCLPGLALAKQLYESVRAIGYGRKGTHALMMALEQMSGVKR